MPPFCRYCLLSIALSAMTLLGISLGQWLGNCPVSRQSIDGWGLRELADHLNHEGLHVRLQSTIIKVGALGRTAFLTTTDHDWEDLNHLTKDSNRLKQWRGIVYCARVGESDPVLRQWGDHCLVAGPFAFYGDAELSERIGAILAPLAAP